MRVHATRRDLVKGGVGLSALLSLAAGADPAIGAAATGSEQQSLSYALRMERLAVIAYDQVLASGVLTTHVAALLRVLGDQERQHVARLEQILRAMGAALPHGPDGVAAAQALLAEHGVHRSLTQLPTQHDCLRLLIDVESLTEGAYFDAFPKLEDPTLVRLSLEMMGAEAQHWSVISTIQHEGDVGVSVPYPFVQGTP